jgi:mannose-6-phosphate isomerase-like protein (cupin superfamily)
MHVTSWTPDDLAFEDAYNVHAKRLFPWGSLPDPDFGSAWVEVRPGMTSTAHAHDETELFLIVEGEGEMVVAGERRRVRAGDAVYIPAHQDHALTNAGPDRLLFVTVFWHQAERGA